MALIVCESCSRHVAPASALCPFCRARISTEAVPKRPFEGRRGALLAAGLATANLAACAQSVVVSSDSPSTAVDASVVAVDPDPSVDPDPVPSDPDAGVVAPPVDPGDWIPTPIYEAIPPRR